MFVDNLQRSFLVQIKYKKIPHPTYGTRDLTAVLLLFYDHAIFIPEVMPVICTMPQEYLSFYKTVAFFQGCDGCHFLICKRILGDTFQVACIVMDRERNGDLTSLMCPFQSDQSRMNTMCFCDCNLPAGCYVLPDNHKAPAAGSIHAAQARRLQV